MGQEIEEHAWAASGDHVRHRRPRHVLGVDARGGLEGANEAAFYELSSGEEARAASRAGEEQPQLPARALREGETPSAIMKDEDLK